MRHKFADDVNINLNVDIQAEELESLVDKCVDGAVTIIVVAAVAHILKKRFA